MLHVLMCVAIVYFVMGAVTAFIISRSPYRGQTGLLMTMLLWPLFFLFLFESDN